MSTIKLNSIPNFRDVGGLPVSGGRRIAGGRILRAEAAARLAPEDNQALAALPTLSVFDLRSVRERNELSSPYMVNARATLLTVDVPHSSGAADMVKTMNEMMDAEPGALESYMHVTYRQFPQQFAETLRDLLQRLLGGDAPVLVHCTAGKDRTGFVCAALLHALGASAEAIEADYMLSDTHFGRERIARMVREHWGRKEAPLHILDALRVKKDYLESALTAVQQGFGSMDGYLESLGLDDAGRRALRERLTVPA